MDTTGLWIILAILLVLSGFFSSAETAYTSLNRVKIKVMADENNRKAQKTLLIFDNFDITITTILFCNNVVNIATASIATILTIELFPKLSTDMIALISTLVVTVIVLIFGEVLPKNYAKYHSEKWALSISSVLLLLIKILKPFSVPILKVNKVFLRFYKTGEKTESSVTEDELKAYIDAIEEEGVLEEEEGELVRSVLDFDETSIGDILTPRTDVVGIDIETPTDELLEIILNEKFSRLPLYEDDLDNVIGLIYERDILVHLAKEQKIDLRAMYRPALFVPKSMKASNLLKYLQEKNAHMAIVIDEFGGTCGVITMEDLLEEIVGDIWDEHDEVVEKVVERDGALVVSNDYQLDDFYSDYLENEQLPETEYTTVAGWVYELLEVMPQEGNKVVYESDNYKLDMEVLKIDNNRIEQLKITTTLFENNEKEIKI